MPALFFNTQPVESRCLIYSYLRDPRHELSCHPRDFPEDWKRSKVIPVLKLVGNVNLR